MNGVFANTFFWVALTDNRDRFYPLARKLAADLRFTPLFTSEIVLIDLVNFFSEYGPHFRRAAVNRTREILESSQVTVVEMTNSRFLAVITLHSQRPDKSYSLTDCISMQMMRELGIFEILTHDHHFAQEGFVALMRGDA